MRKLLPLLLLALAPVLMAVGVDVFVVSDGNQIEYEDGPGGHGFPRLAQEAGGGVAAECNEAAETGQLIMDTTAAAGIKLEICTAAGWEIIGGSSTGAGDNVSVEDGDNAGTFTDAEDARFVDDSDINFTLNTAPAPDEVAALVRDDAVEDNQDLLDFQDDATADTCSATEATEGSMVRRNAGDTAWECVQHYRNYVAQFQVYQVPTHTGLNPTRSGVSLTCLRNQLVIPFAVWANGNDNPTAHCSTLGTESPLGRRQASNYMEIYPPSRTVILRDMVCSIECDAGAVGQCGTANETVVLEPYWHRYGNHSADTAIGTTITVTNDGAKSQNGIANYAGAEIQDIDSTCPYSRCGLKVAIITNNLTGGTDWTLTCTGFVDVSELE